MATRPVENEIIDGTVPAPSLSDLTSMTELSRHRQKPCWSWRRW